MHGVADENQAVRDLIPTVPPLLGVGSSLRRSFSMALAMQLFKQGRALIYSVVGWSLRREKSKMFACYPKLASPS